MSKKSLSIVGLTLVAALSLSACDTGPMEEPEVVLEKAITGFPEVHQAETDLNLSFNEPGSDQMLELKLMATEKNNMEDSEKPQSESNVKAELSASLFDPFLGDLEFEVNGDFDITMIGEDLYATLNSLDISSEALGEMEELIDIGISAFEGQAIHLNYNDFASDLEMLTGESLPDLSESTQLGDEILQDIADAKVIVAETDHGVEKVETLSGDNINAYHYTLALDGTNLEDLLKTLNDNLDLGIELEIEMIFEELKSEGMSIDDIMAVVNEAMNVEVWIDKENYNLTKTVITSDKEMLFAAIEKAAEVDGEVSEEELEDVLEEMAEIEFNLDLTIQMEGIDAFELEAPEDAQELEDLIEGLGNLGGFGMGGMIPSGSDLYPSISPSDMDLEMPDTETLEESLEDLDYSELEEELENLDLEALEAELEEAESL